MYGDTAALRRRAGQLREQGSEIRRMAERLVAQSESVPWHGRAADSMRTRIKDRAAHLREAAGLHETAAESLERHVHEVDRLQDAIATIERKTESLVTDARSRVGALEAAADGRAVQPTDEDAALLAFAPPPPGHRDWLSVELPGL